ncbi:hypothetical protein ACT4ML_03580 [Natrinema sp. LN54]
MSIDGRRSNVGIGMTRWSPLERDWKRVAIGIATVALELQIPR